jgi:hypothetical protein
MNIPKVMRHFEIMLIVHTGCPKNGVLMVHYGVEEITVNARKMLKKFYWTYLFADLAVFESGTKQVNYFEIHV